MKKYFSLLLSLVIALSLTTRVHAGAAGGGSTEWTQIINSIQLIQDNVKSTITSVNTAINTAKTTIGNPFLAAMITGAQQQAARDMNNWAKGNFQGNSSLVTKPETYLRNVGLEAVRGGLVTVTTNNPLGDKVLGAVIRSFRNDGNLEKELANIARSDLPALIKKTSCSDAHLNQLVASEGLVPGTAEFTARKTGIYNNLCAGDPNTDPALAQRLITYNNTNPIAQELTGLDSILLISSGQNEYARSMRAVDATKKAAEKKEELAKADLAAGQGNVAQKTCAKFATNDDEGNPWPPGIAPCLEYKTTTAGGQVNVTLSSSLTAGIDRLTNLGPDGFAAILGSYFMSVLTNKAVDLVANNNDAGGTSASANANYFSVSTISGVAATVTNTPVTTVTTKVYTQNLLTDPDTKNALTTPMLKQLASYTIALDDLAQTDKDYTPQVDTVQSRISSVKSCFDSLVQRWGPYATDPTVLAAYPTLIELQAKVDLAKAKIQTDALQITTARTLIATTRAAIIKSNSSLEINDIFTKYQSDLDTQNLPAITASADSMAYFEKLRSSLVTPGSTQDRLADLQAQCTYLGQQISFMLVNQNNGQ